MVSLTGIKNGAVSFGKLLVQQDAQNNAGRKVDSKAAQFRGMVSEKASTTLRILSEDAYEVVRAPITRLENASIERKVITREDRAGTAGMKKLYNRMAAYHEGVASKGEKLSRNVAAVTVPATRTLLTVATLGASPILKFLGAENVARIVDFAVNAVAVAVGFVVRGVLLAITQMAHLLPYAAVAGAIGASAYGIGIGAIALAAKIGVTAATLTISSGVQTIALMVIGGIALNNSNQIHAMRMDQIHRDEAAQAETERTSLKNRAKAALGAIKNNPMKVAAAAILTGGAAAAGMVGRDAIEAGIRNAISAVSLYFNPPGTSPVRNDVAEAFKAAQFNDNHTPAISPRAKTMFEVLGSKELGITPAMSKQAVLVGGPSSGMISA